MAVWLAITYPATALCEPKPAHMDESDGRVLTGRKWDVPVAKRNQSSAGKETS
jgi:hypothetical protein